MVAAICGRVGVVIFAPHAEIVPLLFLLSPAEVPMQC